MNNIFLIGIISSSIFGCETSPATIKCAAGILPLVYDASNSNYYFLLGKEHCNDGYHSHGTYSDFGGMSIMCTETPGEIALREFREETGLADSLYDLPFNNIKLDEYYHSVMKFSDGSTYHMYLLPIPYEQIKTKIFRNALKRRDGEKSTIALFPVIPFVKTFENFQKEKSTYQERVDGKIIEYPIRQSFRRSFEIMIRESTVIRDILSSTKIGDNLTVKIIDDNLSENPHNNQKEHITRGKLIFSLVFCCVAAVIFLMFLNKNCSFQEPVTNY